MQHEKCCEKETGQCLPCMSSPTISTQSWSCWWNTCCSDRKSLRLKPSRLRYLGPDLSSIGAPYVVNTTAQQRERSKRLGGQFSESNMQRVQGHFVSARPEKQNVKTKTCKRTASRWGPECFDHCQEGLNTRTHMYI